MNYGAMKRGEEKLCEILDIYMLKIMIEFLSIITLYILPYFTSLIPN